MKFLTLIFELFVGKYADALSAVLGLVGALAFAKAPIESLKFPQSAFANSHAHGRIR